MSAPDPQALAQLHAAAFTLPRPWTAAEFAALLADKDAAVIALPPARPLALAALRVIAGEAELLTLAVDPQARRSGLGRQALDQALRRAVAAGAARVFLEVRADNVPALQLYRQAGFQPVGRRPGYYGAGLDALILRRALP